MNQDINLRTENTEPHLYLTMIKSTVHSSDPDASSAYTGF